MVGLPKELKSPYPRSSANRITMLGGCARWALGRCGAPTIRRPSVIAARAACFMVSSSRRRSKEGVGGVDPGNGSPLHEPLPNVEGVRMLPCEVQVADGFPLVAGNGRQLAGCVGGIAAERQVVGRPVLEMDEIPAVHFRGMGQRAGEDLVERRNEEVRLLLRAFRIHAGAAGPACVVGENRARDRVVRVVRFPGVLMILEVRVRRAA